MLLIQTPQVGVNLAQNGVRLPKQGEQLWEANKPCSGIALSDDQAAQKLSQTVFQHFYVCMLLPVAAFGTAATRS